MPGKEVTHKRPWGAALTALAAAVAATALASFREGYPLFHLMAEVVSLALGLSIFMVLHQARGSVRSPALRAIGVSCLFSSLLDLAHALTHQDISLIQAPPGSTEQFWMASQAVLAVGMLAATLLKGTRPGYRTMFLAFFALSGSMASSILVWRIFPDQGAGSAPTVLTLVLGYGLALVFASCALLLRLNRPRFPPAVVRRLTCALALMAAAEFIYTAYPGNVGPAGLAAHLLKMGGFVFAYSALAWSAFESPLESLFTAIKRHEEELSAQNERLTAQGRAIAELTKHPALTGGDLREAIPMLLEKSVNVLNGDRGGVWLMNSESDRLTSLDIFRRKPDLHEGGQVLKAADHPRFFAMLTEGRVLSASDGREDPVFETFVRQVIGTDRPVAIMASGIRRRGRLVGMTCLARLSDGPPWPLDQQLFLGSLADLAALAMEARDRLAEQRVRAESEERLDALIQALPDQVCFKDRESRWLVANRAMLESYGLGGLDYKGRTLAELEELTGQDSRPVFGPVSRSTDEEAWRVGQSDFCMMTVAPDGETRAFEVLKKVIGGEDSPRGLMMLGRDVTSHRQALEELRNSSAELETVYNKMQDGLITVDLKSRRVLRANPAMIRMFGYGFEELRDLEGELPSATSHKETIVSLLGVLTSGRASRVENIRCRRKDGGTIWIDATMSRFSQNGRPAVLAVVRDITRRRRDEEALACRAAEVAALNQGLEDRVAAAVEENRCKDLLLVQQSRLAVMGEMIGNIAHQWRQPLNALGLIVTNLILDVKDGSITPEEADTYSRQCRDILSSMSRTIDDFRSFFQPDKLKRHFSVKDAVIEALSLVEASLSHHNIAVELDMADDPWISGYKGEYSQVALNLLANARDAVTLDGRRGGRIRVRVGTRDDEVEFSVADDGGGISQDTLARVFDPYFTTKSQDKGTGLGLYLSKRIIEEHMGGRITVANDSEGAVFTVTVPLDQPEETQRKDAS